MRDEHVDLVLIGDSKIRSSTDLGGSTIAFLLVMAVLIVAIFAPVLALAVAIIGVALTYRRAVPLAGLVAVIVVSALLAWVNTGKSIAGDWVWYTTHYRYLETLSLDQYLGERIGPYEPALTEPIYYALSRVISRLSGANVEVLAVSVTLLIYVTIGVALVIAVSAHTKHGWTLVAATIAGMLTGLTFTLSTQLVRQEIAASFIGLGLVLIGRQKRLPGYLALAAGILSHNSALMPVAGILVASMLARSRRGWMTGAALIAALFFLFGRLYLGQSGINYEGQSDGTISPYVMIMDALIFLIFISLTLRGGLRDSRIARLVLFCTPAFYAFLFAIISQPIPFLRMYFYIEVLRCIMIALIIVWAMRGKLKLFVGAAAVIVAVLYVNLRIEISPFEYSANFLETLFNNLI